MLIFSKDRDLLIDTTGAALFATEKRITTDNWKACISAHFGESEVIVAYCGTLSDARELLGSIARHAADGMGFITILGGIISDARREAVQYGL